MFRYSCSRLRFIIITAIFFTAFGNIAFFAKTINLLAMNELSDYLLVGSFAIFLFCFLNILFSILFIGFFSKTLAIIFLFCSAFANYFSYFYDVYIDKEMIENVLQTNTGEAFALITTKLLLWVICFALVPSIIVLWVKITDDNRVTKNIAYRLVNILVSAIVLFAVSYPMYSQYAFFIRQKTDNQILKLITPSNYIQGSVSYIKKLYHKNMPFIHIAEDAVREKTVNQQKKLLIIVVGETSRGMNFSLNGYPRNTNPLLKNQDIINFQKASSCGTATATSVPCMFSAMEQADYKGEIAERQDNLLDILNRTNVNILWKENDSGCKGVCERVSTQEIKTILPKDDCSDGLCYDIRLLDNLDEYINSNTDDTVIVLHTNGSHGPAYYRRYQQAQEHFKPACSTNAVETCSSEELVNAYDNTIVNVDFVLNGVIELLKKHSNDFATSMIYVSDHGESLGENGIYLHGTPYAIAPKQQTHIPMIMWLSESFLKEEKIDRNCMLDKAKKTKISHDNLFHSVLGVMSVKTGVYDPKLDLFKSCKVTP